MFREVTERFFLRGLDRLSEKKSDLWSDRRFSDTDLNAHFLIIVLGIIVNNYSHLLFLINII